jgi:hypothetical protein
VAPANGDFRLKQVGPDFSQAERGLFAIRFRRHGCGGSFDAALARLAQG